MGYELRIIVVEKTTQAYSDGTFCRNFIELELAKPDQRFIEALKLVAVQFNKDGPHRPGFYGTTDGNTQCSVDRYGETLRQTTVDEAIKLLDDGIAKGTVWEPMALVAISTLSVLKTTPLADRSMFVLWFGH